VDDLGLLTLAISAWRLAIACVLLDTSLGASPVTGSGSSSISGSSSGWHSVCEVRCRSGSIEAGNVAVQSDVRKRGQDKQTTRGVGSLRIVYLGDVYLVKLGDSCIGGFGGDM